MRGIYRTRLEGLELVVDSVVRQLIALIDGLWLEYCLHSAEFSLAAAKTDCHWFLQSHGILIVY